LKIEENKKKKRGEIREAKERGSKEGKLSWSVCNYPIPVFLSLCFYSEILVVA
jgi:hypothetical protein